MRAYYVEVKFTIYAKPVLSSSLQLHPHLPIPKRKALYGHVGLSASLSIILQSQSIQLGTIYCTCKAPAPTSHMGFRPPLCIRLICTYTSLWLHQYAPVWSTGLLHLPQGPYLYGSTLSTGVVQSERWNAGAPTNFDLTRRTSQNCCIVKSL